MFENELKKLVKEHGMVITLYLPDFEPKKFMAGDIYFESNYLVFYDVFAESQHDVHAVGIRGDIIQHNRLNYEIKIIVFGNIAKNVYKNGDEAKMLISPIEPYEDDEIKMFSDWKAEYNANKKQYDDFFNRQIEYFKMSW